MGNFRLDEPSKKSLWIYAQTSQTMGPLVWIKLIILGKWALKTFSQMDFYAIRSFVWSTSGSISQLIDEKSISFVSQTITTTWYAFSLCKLYKDISSYLKAYSSWGQKLHWLCSQEMCSIEPKDL